MQILVNGRPVREYSKNGRNFIEAREGTEYSIKLKNNSNRRAKIIFSVDGLDVIGGKSADKAKTGYIVDSYDSIEIKGFRYSDDSVASFKFDRKSLSYSKSKTGNTLNCGVIGARIILEKEQQTPIVFKEKEYIPYYPYPKHPWNPPYDPWYDKHPWVKPYEPNIVWYDGDASETPSYSANMCSADFNSLKSSNIGGCSRSASNKAPDFELGTSWGKKIHDKVKTVEFYSSNESFDMELFYTTRKSLEEIGIDFDNVKNVHSEKFPKAFKSNKNYCEIPNSWKE